MNYINVVKRKCTESELVNKLYEKVLDDHANSHPYEDGHWQAFITIDGWSKLINSHPAFNGISFTESTELVGGIPAWMGCAIYRNDRVVPIEVKEYLCEIQTEHSVWQAMPRRMLRHRVIAQCARLAFGVSMPEIKQSLSKSSPRNLMKDQIFIPLPKRSRTDEAKEQIRESKL